MRRMMSAALLLVLAASPLAAQDGPAPTIKEVRFEARSAWNRTRRDFSRRLAEAKAEEQAAIEADRDVRFAAIMEPLWAAVEAKPGDAESEESVAWILRQRDASTAGILRAADFARKHYAEGEGGQIAVRSLIKRPLDEAIAKRLESFAAVKNAATAAWARYGLALPRLIGAKDRAAEDAALAEILALAGREDAPADLKREIARTTTSYRFAPGRPAPEIEGQDLDGAAFKLSDYRGKVVLIDFWGTW
ncbi:MAG: hypothetical protein R3F20_19420 [Planctomycetota bacterium]